MAEENKPIEATDAEETMGGGEPLTEEQIEDIANTAPHPSSYPEGQAEELAERMPVEQPNAVDKASVAAVAATEAAQSTAPVQAFDKVVSEIQEGIEAIGGAPKHVQDHHHSDTTVLFGRELPYSIYTVVFFALGFLTITEVILAEILINVEVVKIPVLLGIATAKALLVVIFYMHLKDDSRIFALTLAIPVGIALLSVIFLISVPHTGGY